MARIIQIRNVPEALHRTLTARAAQAGMTLSDYLLREVERSAARPTHEELCARMRARKRRRLCEGTATAVRAERDARG